MFYRPAAAAPSQEWRMLECLFLAQLGSAQTSMIMRAMVRFISCYGKEVLWRALRVMTVSREGKALLVTLIIRINLSRLSGTGPLSQPAAQPAHIQSHTARGQPRGLKSQFHH